MALTYTIKNYEVDPQDDTKTYIGFSIKDEKGNVFLIDKKVTTGDKTQPQLLAAAQAAGQAEIDAWQKSKADLGKTWNPDTGEVG